MPEISGPGPSAPPPAPERPAPSSPPAPAAQPAPSKAAEPRDRATLTPPTQETPPKSTDTHVAGLNSAFSNRPPSIQDRTRSALDSGNSEQQREIARELLEKQRSGQRLSPEELHAARQIQERPITMEATLRKSGSRIEQGREVTETHRIGYRSQDPNRPDGFVNELERSTERKYSGSPRVPLLPYIGKTNESREIIDLNTGQRRSENVQRMVMGRRSLGFNGEQVTPADGRQPNSSAGASVGGQLPGLKVGVAAEGRLSTSDGLARRDAMRIARRQTEVERADRIRETRRQVLEGN